MEKNTWVILDEDEIKKIQPASSDTMVRPRDHGLTLHTIFYPDEVRQVPECGKIGDVDVRPQEVELAQKLVASLATPFDPKQFHDTHRQRLRELIEAKSEGKSVHGEAPKKLAPVIDLMAALEKSLAGSTGKKPAAKEPTPAAAAHTRKKRKAS